MFQAPPPPSPSIVPSPSADPIFNILDDIKANFEKTISEGFAKVVEEMTTSFNELEKSSLTISKNLGRGAEFGFGLRQTFVDALPDVKRLGGQIANVQKIQEDVIKATGRGIQLAADEFSKFYATTNLLTTTTDEIVSTFKNIGVSIHDAASETEKIILTASKLGLSIEAVYSNVSNNIDKINAYNFQNGVEGLTRMAATATSLKINMSETFNFADKVMNPEGAIEMANAFQRLGAGTSALLDPLKLMDLSMNDPEELQNQIVKMTQQYTKFNDETGRFEITNKRMFRELSKEIGISYDQLTKMALGSSDLQRKLSEIKFPEGAITKEQREMIANMAELKQGVGYVVRVQEEGEIKEKRITELSKDNIEYLTKAPKTAEEIQKQSLTTSESIAADVAAIRAKITGVPARSPLAEQMSRSLRAVTDSLNQTLGKAGFNSKNIQQITEDIIKTSTRSIAKGDLSGIKDLIERIQDKTSGVDISKFMDTFQETLKQNAYSSMNLGDATKYIEEMTKTVRNVFKKDDFIYSQKEGIIEPNPEDIIFGMLPKNIEKEQNKVIENTSLEKNLPQLIETPNPVALMEKMKLMSPNTNMGSQTQKMEFGEMSVNVKLDVAGVQDQNIAEQLRIALSMKQGYLADAIAESVKKSMSNNGMTG